MNFDITTPVEQLFHSFIASLPTILTFLAVVVAGLILAPIAAKVVRALVERVGLETLLERLGAPKLLYRIGYNKSTATLLGSIGRLLVYVVTALIAADIARMSQVSRGLDALVAYLPRFTVAVLFLLVGFWAADMIRGVVAKVAHKQQGQLIGTVLYYGVVAVTVALVADQLGLETSLINHIIVLVIAGVVAAVAIAMALSARPTLSNHLARNYVVQLYPRGDTVEIDGVTGIVKGHSPTALVLVGEDATYNIPYVRFMEETVTTKGAARPIVPSRNDNLNDDEGNESGEDETNEG